MITGYKFTADERRNIFYVTLSCFNEKRHTDGYSTTDCIVEKIENANTGEIVQEVNGEAYYPFTYKTGEHITGQEIYYCHSIQELFDLVHIEKVNGRVRCKTLSGCFRYFDQVFDKMCSEYKENMLEIYQHNEERRNRAIEREKLRQERINRAIEREERRQKKMNLAVERKEINQRMRNRMTEYAKKRGWIEADVE